MRGLKDLDVALEWRFRLVRHGLTLAPSPGVIAADVGNSLAEGILDTHQDCVYESSTEAIAENPHLVLNHLLGPLNQNLQMGRSIEEREIEFQFVTHLSPDWDGASSFLLCDHLVRYGELPPWTSDLVEATNLIDQSKVRMQGNHRRAFLLFDALAADAGGNPGKLFTLFKELVLAIVEHVEPEVGGNPFCDVLPTIPALAFIDHWDDRLKKDFELFEEDMKHSEDFEVELPLNFGQLNGSYFKIAKAVAFTRPTDCLFSKFWIRESNACDLLLIPYCNGESEIPDRWVISVDPSSNLSLRRFGFELERMEKLKRGDERRRGGKPRWDDSDYSDNSDPWYDGRNHGYTIVDSPRFGTVLGLAEIREALQSRFHGISMDREHHSLRLVVYRFLEVPLGFDYGRGIPSRPLESFRESFLHLREVELRSIELQLEQELPEGVRYRLLLSEASHHGILEVVSQPSDESYILEEIPTLLEDLQDLACRIADEAMRGLGLSRKIWGTLGYSVAYLPSPDFLFHSNDKIRAVLCKICRDGVVVEEVKRIRGDAKIEDLVRPAASVCVLRTLDSNVLESRMALVLYALFVRSGYRRFSSRFEDLAPSIKMGEQVERQLKDILEIQREFTLFLGKYDFTSTELSTNADLNAFYSSIAGAVGLEGQKKETFAELRVVGDLASSLHGVEEQANTVKINEILQVLAIFGIGDFMYALAHDVLNQEGHWVPAFGMAVFFLGGLYLVLKKWIFR